MRKDLDLKEMGFEIIDGVLEVNTNDIYKLIEIKNVVAEIIYDRKKIKIEEFNNYIYNIFDNMNDYDLKEYYSKIIESKENINEKERLINERIFLAEIINSLNVDDFQKLTFKTSEKFVLNMLRYRNNNDLQHLLYNIREDYKQIILDFSKDKNNN